MNPFERMLHDNPPESFWGEYNDAAFESRAVEGLMTVLGLAARKRRVQQRCEQRTGRLQLTFDDFDAEFPRFPLVLRCRRLQDLHLDPKMLLPALFARFLKTPIVTAWQEAKEAYEAVHPARSRPFGLIFPRRGVAGGLVLREGPEYPAPDCNQLTLVYRIDVLGDPPRILRLEAYRQLAAGLAVAWQPE